MTTYGIIIQLVAGSLLLAGSIGQTIYEGDNKVFEEYFSTLRFDLKLLYYFADEIFGTDNWSHDVYQTCDTEKAVEDQDVRFVECQSTVMISLSNGIRHTGVGSDSGFFSLNDGFAPFQRKSVENGFYNALMAFKNASSHIFSFAYGHFKERKMPNYDENLSKVDENKLDKVPIE